MNTDTQHYKLLLETEKKRIKKELGETAVQADKGKNSFDAIQPETGEDTADREDVAEAIESYENNDSAVVTLRTELNEVEHALEKITAGTFGTCEECGKEIESDRLEANPGARTCKEHLGDL